MEGKTTPKIDEDKIMHIGLPIGEQILLASDAPESMGFKVNFGNHLYISVHSDSKANADNIFKGFSEDGMVEMAIADHPWGDYWGSLKDKFGVLWMVTYEYPKE